MNGKYFWVLVGVVLAGNLSACNTVPVNSIQTSTSTVVQSTPTTKPAETIQPTTLEFTPTSSPVVLTPTLSELTEEQILMAQSLLNENCAVCHSPDKVNRIQADATRWGEIIARMVDHGAVISEDEALLLTQYLAERTP